MRAENPGKKFIGWVSAGFPSPAKDYEEEDIDLNKDIIPNKTSIYFARVHGNSMSRSNIPDKSLVVIDKSLQAKQGSIVVASLDGQLMLKQLLETTNGKFLTATNPLFKPIRITPESDFAIWGVVTHVIVDLSKINAYDSVG